MKEEEKERKHNGGKLREVRSETKRESIVSSNSSRSSSRRAGKQTSKHAVRFSQMRDVPFTRRFIPSLHSETRAHKSHRSCAIASSAHRISVTGETLDANFTSIKSHFYSRTLHSLRLLEGFRPIHPRFMEYDIHSVSCPIRQIYIIYKKVFFIRNPLLWSTQFSCCEFDKWNKKIRKFQTILHHAIKESCYFVDEFPDVSKVLKLDMKCLFSKK